MCSCSPGLTGNAFIACKPVPGMYIIDTQNQSMSKEKVVNNIFNIAPVAVNPCNPSPCGPNSICREINGQATCSCILGYIGSPPTCRPECVISAECPLNQACVNQKCIDPCPGTCGLAARCEVINHNPICSCPPKYTGDPFIRCQPIRNINNPLTHDKQCIYQNVFIVEQPVIIPDTPRNPCVPSPCGPYSDCVATGSGSPSCTCQLGYTGAPPNCRPECISNGDCANHLACINQKCADPCPGSCGLNAECRVVTHIPNCICIEGYIGDPFTICNLKPRKEMFIILT